MSVHASPGFRPCGVCRSLVPALSGCKHWRPGIRPLTQAERQKAYRDRQKVRDQKWRASLEPEVKLGPGGRPKRSG